MCKKGKAAVAEKKNFCSALPTVLKNTRCTRRIALKEGVGRLTFFDLRFAVSRVALVGSSQGSYSCHQSRRLCCPLLAGVGVMHPNSLPLCCLLGRSVPFFTCFTLPYPWRPQIVVAVRAPLLLCAVDRISIGLIA